MSQPIPPRLTLAQLLTVPIFSAVVLACIVPVIRSGAVREFGIIPIVLGEAIVVPLMLAITAQLISKRGRLRERLVAVFLWASALAAIVVLLLLGAVSAWDVYEAIARGRGLPVDLAALVIAMLGGVIALNVVVRDLWPRAFPERCPGCGRRTLFPDADEPDSPGRSTRTLHSCESCGRRVHRESGGEENALGEPPDRSGLQCSEAKLIGLK